MTYFVLGLIGWAIAFLAPYAVANAKRTTAIVYLSRKFVPIAASSFAITIWVLGLIRFLIRLTL